MRLPFYKKQLALAVGIATFAATSVYAEQADDINQMITLEEIVVTAQKREQNMQDTPISMAAFGAETMKNKGIGDVSDASQYIPNVMAVPTPGGSTGATVSVRGSVSINPAVTWEPTVGMYVDGVFVAKNMGGLFDVAELERIEVLRGPQGTLYGKNTIGGAINVITRKPGEEFGGTARVKVGNYNYSDVFLSVDTGKLGDVASFNVAINKRDRDGLYKNTVNPRPKGVAKRFGEQDVTSGRVAALFDVTDDLELYYTYDISEKDNTPVFGQRTDLPGSKIDKRIEGGALDNAYYDKSTTQGHAFHVTWDIDDMLTFKSITAYRGMKFKDLNDYDGTANPAEQFEVYRNFTTDQYSQEFQLLGSTDIADFVVGLYYLNEDTDAKNNFYLPIGDVLNNYGVDGESVALFGQADWKLTHALTLTTGLRWTRESKEAYMAHNDQTLVPYDPPANTIFGPAFGGVVPKSKAKDSWSSVTPMVALSYLWDGGINTYVKVSQGWKAGGFNGEAGPQGTLTAEQVFQQSYDPEKVTSYEIGMKSRWYDNRLQANIAYFYNDIKDMQISDLSTVPVYSDIKNAGKAVMQGVEMDFAMQIVDGLTATASYSYLDAKYKKYDAGGYGKKDAFFPYAPRHNGTIGFEYKANVGVGDLLTTLDYSVTSGYSVFDNPDNAKLTNVKKYGLLNGRIALANMKVGDKQSLEVGVWGKNLTDEEYRLNGIPAGPGVGLNYYGDPRTFGADVTYKF